MIGAITKIHDREMGHTHNVAYQRIEFRLENGLWAKTDLCPAFRNWHRWKGLLKVGNLVTGLIVEGATVDADSPVAFAGDAAPEQMEFTRKPKPDEPPDPQLSLL